MTRENATTDILIAGGGFAGLTLAIALRQALGPSFKVAVADPTLGKSRDDDERASAIVAAARRLLETIGAWQNIADKAQPILDMVVTDSRLDDAVRPTFLTFAGDVEPGEPFAHMVENRDLLAALEAKAREVGRRVADSARSPISLPSPGGGGSTAVSESGWGDRGAASTPPRTARAVDPPPPGEGGVSRFALHSKSTSHSLTAR